MKREDLTKTFIMILNDFMQTNFSVVELRDKHPAIYSHFHSIKQYSLTHIAPMTQFSGIIYLYFFVVYIALRM